MKWNKSTKIPQLFSNQEDVIYLRNMTVTIGVRKSKDILIRINKHSKNHYHLGNDGWKDYPDSQVGRYKYVIGHYTKHESNDKEFDGFYDDNNRECNCVEWTYLPKSVDAGYTW